MPEPPYEADQVRALPSVFPAPYLTTSHCLLPNLNSLHQIPLPSFIAFKVLNRPRARSHLVITGKYPLPGNSDKLSCRIPASLSPSTRRVQLSSSVSAPGKGA